MAYNRKRFLFAIPVMAMGTVCPPTGSSVFVFLLGNLAIWIMESDFLTVTLTQTLT